MEAEGGGESVVISWLFWLVRALLCIFPNSVLWCHVGTLKSAKEEYLYHGNGKCYESELFCLFWELVVKHLPAHVTLCNCHQSGTELRCPFLAPYRISPHFLSWGQQTWRDSLQEMCSAIRCDCVGAYIIIHSFVKISETCQVPACPEPQVWAEPGSESQIFMSADIPLQTAADF